MKLLQTTGLIIFYTMFSVFIFQAISTKIKKPDYHTSRTYLDNHPEVQALEAERKSLIAKSYREGLFENEVARGEKIEEMIEAHAIEGRKIYSSYLEKKSKYNELVFSAILSIIAIYGIFSFFSIKNWYELLIYSLIPTFIYLTLRDTLAIYYFIILLVSIWLPFLWKRVGF